MSPGSSLDSWVCLHLLKTWTKRKVRSSTHNNSHRTQIHIFKVQYWVICIKPEKKNSGIWKPKMFQSVYFLYKFCRFCSSQVHIRYSVMLHHWWPLLVINVCFVKRKNVQTRITFTKSISKMEFIFWKKNKVRTRCTCKQSGLGDYYTLHYSSI